MSIRCILSLVLTLWLLAALSPWCAAQEAKPVSLDITGWLSDKEPFDRLRKQSHHKVCAHRPNRSHLWFVRIGWRYVADLHGD